MNRKYILLLIGLLCLCVGPEVFAVGKASGLAIIAGNVRNNLGAVAKLITALSYIAGMAFVIGAIVKFKAHKETPTQTPIGTPIALLFIGAALIFVPSVFSTAGGTLFGTSGVVGGISGISSFS